MDTRTTRTRARAVAAALAAAVALTASSAAEAAPQARTVTLRPARPAARPIARPAIVNGTPISIAQVPWQVFVQVDLGGGRTGNCGGAIVDASTVVTAAHCVVVGGQLLSVAAMKVAAGVSDVLAPEPSAQLRDVASVRVHPYYTGGGGAVAPDDVAVLTLAAPLTLSDAAGTTARAIPLTTAGAYPAAGAVASISGFGRQAASTQPNGKLYALETGVNDPLLCGGDANAVVLCVASQTGSACQGDSGGPLTIGGSLAGITSFVTINGPTGECGVSSLNGYANLAAPEILDFVRGVAEPPRAPRGGRDVSARGVFQAGSTMTCSPGAWSGSPSFTFSFTDTRTGAVLQSGPHTSYTFAPGDVGRTVACHVSAANAGGTGITRTEASQAIAAAPPGSRSSRASLRLSVGPSRTRAAAGGTVTHTIRVVNRGGAAARGVVVCAAPARGLAFRTLPKGARRSRGRACWRLGTVRANGGYTLRVTLRVAPGARAGQLVNRVTVASANGGRRAVAGRVRVG